MLPLFRPQDIGVGMMSPVPFDMGSPFAREVACLDLGGAFTKAVFFFDWSILPSAVVPTNPDPRAAAREALDQALVKVPTAMEDI
jgi:hypothetical protein